MFHAECWGAPPATWTSSDGEQAVRRSLRQNRAGHGPAILEGPWATTTARLSSEFSAWDPGPPTATPAVLVVDGRGRPASLAAWWWASVPWRGEHGIRGVLFNRVSPRVLPRPKDCVEGGDRHPGLRLPSGSPRCLPGEPPSGPHHGRRGVRPGGESSPPLAAQAEKSVDLDGLLALARSAPDLPPEEGRTSPPLIPSRPRIAVAPGRGVLLLPADALELLEKLGAALVPFSPLRDEELRRNAPGSTWGGGYPELYGRRWPANTAMRRAVRLAVNRGMPTVAECGGFSTSTGPSPTRTGWTALVGVLPARGLEPGESWGRFGYITLTARTGGPALGAGRAYGPTSSTTGRATGQEQISTPRSPEASGVGLCLAYAHPLCGISARKILQLSTGGGADLWPPVPGYHGENEG